MTVEDVVLVAARAFGALQTTDEEQGHAHRDQNGDGVFADHEPVNQAIHCHSPSATDSTTFDVKNNPSVYTDSQIRADEIPAR